MSYRAYLCSEEVGGRQLCRRCAAIALFSVMACFSPSAKAESGDRDPESGAKLLPIDGQYAEEGRCDQFEYTSLYADRFEFAETVCIFSDVTNVSKLLSKRLLPELQNEIFFTYQAICISGGHDIGRLEGGTIQISSDMENVTIIEDVPEARPSYLKKCK